MRRDQSMKTDCARAEWDSGSRMSRRPMMMLPPTLDQEAGRATVLKTVPGLSQRTPARPWLRR